MAKYTNTSVNIDRRMFFIFLLLNNFQSLSNRSPFVLIIMKNNNKNQIIGKTIYTYGFPLDINLAKLSTIRDIKKIQQVEKNDFTLLFIDYAS
ncbi:hypothetical protein [Companilactobacillus kimchii]|uniref:hypothetical protein n=1 Tax=Companilactobacillus kimchii TaxID=2801452 RepID=UPI0011938C1A|nr:hypothetical protein [Companilactobacillus kimchii]GEO46457.1 hypothetical protein LKI01_04560 [Companilactobacillus paralimentarius]